MLDEITEIFRWFHAHAELGYQETETTARIREILTDLQVEIVETGLRTGLIAVIRGKTDRKKLCLRADLDALPIAEQTGLSYASMTPGIMHACGHDFHITTALAVATLLKMRQESLPNTVYFAFEAGEEVFGGAERVWNTGALREVSSFYGFHADPSLAVGEVGIREGGVMAAVDGFHITVKGVGTHAATPHLGRNPISALMTLVNAMQAHTQSALPPTSPHVLSFTQIHAGSAWNVIPETAECDGTLRTLDAAERAELMAAFDRIAAHVGAMTDCVCELSWSGSAPCVKNDAALCAVAREKATACGLRCVPILPAMVSDDFSVFAEKAKGIYLKIGTGIGHPLHHPMFCADPAAILPTARFLADLLSAEVE